MAHAVLVAKYPNSQFCTFRFENLARSSYQGTQYYLTNTSTGWVSGWQNTPPVSIYNGTSSNFNIYMSPGFDYSIRTRMLWNSAWYEGQYGYEPIYFNFPSPTPQRPSDRIAMDLWSASSSSISMRILGTYGATTVDWQIINQTTGVRNYYTRSTQGTPYYETFSGLTAGTEYVISANGYNAGGYAGEKLANAMTNPVTPAISKGTTTEVNTISINVNPNGGFDLIEVEMWTIDATSRLAIRTQGWNGGSNFSAKFGSLVPNASYLFRARASKTSSYYSPSPSSWGAWLTIKNDMARPTDWVWYSPKASGAEFNMLATEWNAFTAKINEFRLYKSLTAYSFSVAQRGQPFYFYQFNEARAAINTMRSTGLSTVTTGDVIYASHLNTLVSTLNAIT